MASGSPQPPQPKDSTPALLAQLERFQALASLSPDIISIFDREGNLVFNSDAAWKTHGYRASELEGHSTFELIHPDDAPKVQAAFTTLIQNPDTPVCVRYRFRNADGSYKWMEATGRNELNNPHLQGIISISRDISEQIRAEERLREDERRYRMLFAANPHPMMIFDLETLRFLEVNATALELYEYTRDEFLALTIRDIRPPEDLPRFASIVEALKNDKLAGKVPGLWRHRLKSEKIIDVEINTHRIEWAGRAAHLVLVQDVTERLKLEHKLQQTQKMESLGLLAGGIAHDFNNMLTSILGHASLASIEIPEGAPIEESLHLIEESAKRAAELCRQMLAYSGRGHFAVRPVDLNTFVKNAVDLLRISIGRNCHLVFDLTPGLPLIEADTTQLQQVVMNLVINAAEATGAQENSIRLSTRLEHAKHALLETMYLSPDLVEGDYVVLEVSDKGCGMAPETLARVFDPFFTTKFTGRGLGLAAVLGIMRGHRGAIHVDSAPGKGTAFTLLFPATAKQALHDPPPTAPASEEPHPVERTILIVDDEESVRSTAQTILKRRGFRVLLACDGLEGVDLFRRHGPEIHAVLLDLTMPRLDGKGAFLEIKKIDEKATIVLMSGFDENSATRPFAGLGHAGFIQKPFTAQQLASTVEAVLSAQP